MPPNLTPQPHPAAAALPPMSEEEYRSLVESIREHGQQETIVMLGGQILDGRHRWRACVEVGIQPRTREYAGECGGSPAAFVVALNLARRDLTPGQRAMVADNLRPVFAVEIAAKEAQRKAAQPRDTSGRLDSQIGKDPTLLFLAKSGGESHPSASISRNRSVRIPSLSVAIVTPHDLHRLRIGAVQPGEPLINIVPESGGLTALVGVDNCCDRLRFQRQKVAQHVVDGVRVRGAQARAGDLLTRGGVVPQGPVQQFILGTLLALLDLPDRSPKRLRPSLDLRRHFGRLGLDHRRICNRSRANAATGKVLSMPRRIAVQRRDPTGVKEKVFQHPMMIAVTWEQLEEAQQRFRLQRDTLSTRVTVIGWVLALRQKYPDAATPRQAIIANGADPAMLEGILTV